MGHVFKFVVTRSGMEAWWWLINSTTLLPSAYVAITQLVGQCMLKAEGEPFYVRSYEGCNFLLCGATSVMVFAIRQPFVGNPFCSDIAIWLAIAVKDFARLKFIPTIIFGTGLLLFLNLRYLIDGTADGIAFFVSLYDVFDNLGLAANETAAALGACPNNECSLWGDRYLQHQTWGVAFHDRFLNGPEFRSTLLYVHLVFNSIAFVLLHLQLARPGGNNDSPYSHKMVGRVLFGCLTIGTVCAVWLASELDPVGAYGGALSKYGFGFMSLCVYGCAVTGVIKIWQRDAHAHRVWMIRVAGSMWGAYWLFRIMLIFTGPLLRDYETVSLLMSIWLSAPLGILLAEYLRLRLESRERRVALQGHQLA